jgi:hypothetical protein
MKKLGNSLDKIARDPLGAVTLASFFGTPQQQIKMREGVKYEARIVAEDEINSEDEREDNNEKVKINQKQILLICFINSKWLGAEYC